MQRLGHVSEVFDETTIYVTRSEERAGLCNVFWYSYVGNVVVCILSNRDQTRKQNVTEVEHLRILSNKYTVVL